VQNKEAEGFIAKKEHKVGDTVVLLYMVMNRGTFLIPVPLRYLVLSIIL